MRLQTDQEFKQRNIEELDKQFKIEMYSTHLRGKKAFALEQKIRELKKLLLRKKRIHLNNTRSTKYGYSPEQIEEQALGPRTGKILSRSF